METVGSAEAGFLSENAGLIVKKKSPFKKLLWASAVIAVVFLSVMGIRFYNIHRFHLEKQTRFMMDTYVTIYAVGPESLTTPAVNAALNRMQEVDAKFNSLNPESAVYAFNKQGTPITDPEILSIVQSALRVTAESGGAFDITIAPLLELWGFYGESPALPSDADIRKCMENVGFQHLVLTSTDLKKDKPGVKIDLGGIAKGYAIDQAVKVLKSKGIESALIDAGGDIYALGKRGRDMWKVGIKDPRGDGILGYVEVENMSVTGSGDYERFFEVNGKRYHHIFNPRTGQPAEGLSGSTLIYPGTSMYGWSAAVFVLGPEKGLSWVERQAGVEALLVTSSGKALYSSGLKNAVHFHNEK